MRENLLRRLVLVTGIITLTACQDDSRIGEVSTKETEAQMEVQKKYSEEISKKSAQAQLETEQKFKAALANDMETDLTRRQRFYEGVAGVYEGVIQTQNGNFNIRLRLVPSLSPYRQTRVRMQEEIAQDLNNLYLNAQIIQWSGGSSVGAVGCRVTGIRADVDQGQILIASPDCPNFYQILVNDTSPVSAGRISKDGPSDEARRVSQAILEGLIRKVMFIEGIIQPTSSSEQYQFQAERVVK